MWESAKFWTPLLQIGWRLTIVCNAPSYEETKVPDLYVSCRQDVLGCLWKVWPLGLEQTSQEKTAGQGRLGFLFLLLPPLGVYIIFLPSSLSQWSHLREEISRVLLLHRLSPIGCFRSQNLGLWGLAAFPSQAAGSRAGAQGQLVGHKGTEGAPSCIRYRRSFIMLLWQWGWNNHSWKLTQQGRRGWQPES